MAESERTETTMLPLQRTVRQALPWWLQVTVLVLVFMSGGFVGAMIASKVIHGRMEAYRQQASIFSRDIVLRLRFRLGLSADQADKVKEIIERRHSKMIEFRSEGSQKMNREFEAMVNEIAEVLDETQAEKWGGIAAHVRRTYLPTR